MTSRARGSEAAGRAETAMVVFRDVTFGIGSIIIKFMFLNTLSILCSLNV